MRPLGEAPDWEAWAVKYAPMPRTRVEAPQAVAGDALPRRQLHGAPPTAPHPRLLQLHPCLQLLRRASPLRT